MEFGRFHILIAACVIGLKINGIAARCCITPMTTGIPYMNGFGNNSFCNFVQNNPRVVFIRGICENGKLPERLYCGRGSCNILGCACDGGCLDESDTVENTTEICKDINSKRDLYIKHYETCTHLPGLLFNPNCYDFNSTVVEAVPEKESS